MVASGAVMFEDIFVVKQVNPEGKKFNRVARLACDGVSYGMELLMDINSEIYPLSEGEKFSLALASTLALDGSEDDGTYDTSGKPTLLDRYDYGMHGRVFEYKQGGDGTGRISITVSFGGLLMCLKGDQRHLMKIDNDQRIYCLMRKTEQ